MMPNRTRLLQPASALSRVRALSPCSGWSRRPRLPSPQQSYRRDGDRRCCQVTPWALCASVSRKQKAAGALKKLIGATETGVYGMRRGTAPSMPRSIGPISRSTSSRACSSATRPATISPASSEPTFNGVNAAGPPRRRHLGRSAQALPRPRDYQRRERWRLRGQDDHRDDPWLSVARGLEPTDKDPSSSPSRPGSVGCPATSPG
jgi:hypothetical protein